MNGHKWFGVLLLALPGASPLAAAQTGQQAYAQFCASCHGEHGEGAPNWREMQVQGYSMPPALNGEGNSRQRSRGEMLQVIREGNFSNGGIMPPFAGVLSDVEQQALVDYLRSLESGS